MGLTGRFLLSVAVVCVLGGFSLNGQMQENVTPTLECREGSRSGRMATHCEMRELTLAPSSILTVDDVLVRAQVQTRAETESEAQALAGRIRIDTGASAVRAEGPEAQGRQSWSVTYEIFTPHDTNLSLKAHNGGIHIADVRGDIEFVTTNGGVSLERLGGDVRGRTTNGGVSVELAGDRWDGKELDTSTTNGGVKLSVPEGYSARLEAATVNGGIRTDFPVSVQGRIDRQLSLTLGAGGPLIRAVTTNGGVAVTRKR